MAEAKRNEDIAFEFEVMRDYSLRRTRARITRLIDSNLDLKVFVTLTFAKNLKELKETNIIFKKFILRLRYLYQNLKYLAVPEFQKRGAVHYHILINTEIAHDKLEIIWGQGFVMINRVKHINNLGMYISKYIGKDLFDIRYFGMRKVLSSKNLEQPITITAFSEVREFLQTAIGTIKPLTDKLYRSDWLGKIRYRLYKP